jgi:hypothetical protein
LAKEIGFARAGGEVKSCVSRIRQWTANETPLGYVEIEKYDFQLVGDWLLLWRKGVLMKGAMSIFILILEFTVGGCWKNQEREMLGYSYNKAFSFKLTISEHDYAVRIFDDEDRSVYSGMKRYRKRDTLIIE